MTTPNFLRHLVPAEWSAEQALLAIDLFTQAKQAIWVVHGESIRDHLLISDRQMARLSEVMDTYDYDHDEDCETLADEPDPEEDPDWAF